MAERSVWSDPQVFSLASSFVAAADEVWRLKRKKDPEGDFFRLFCDLGHYQGGDDNSNTRQGVYVVTPRGELLGSTNSRDPAVVAELLVDCLNKWNAMVAEARMPARDPAEQSADVIRLESKYPEDGLVLRSYSRDLPRADAPDDWRGKAWNQDLVWFTAAEALALATPGYSRAAILSRFARTSLLDNVRGQTEAFEQQDVVESLLTLDCESVEGAVQHFRISGSFRLDRPEEPAYKNLPAEEARGVDAKMLGSATFDTRTQRFTKFDAVAIGYRWGSTRFNGRHDDPGPSPIGWAFVLAGDSAEERIAPAHLWDAYGW